MSLRSRSAASALVCLLAAAGCHRTRVTAAPPPPPAVHVAMISVPPPMHRTEPQPEIPLADVSNIEPQLPRRPVARYRPPPASQSQMAALKPPVPVDLGQLTAGGEADNGTLRQETEALLRGQQRRLAALPRKLANTHIQQVQQARLFLRQADEAWKKLDVEGARTLATKAKVLLDEIQT